MCWQRDIVVFLMIWWYTKTHISSGISLENLEKLVAAFNGEILEQKIYGLVIIALFMFSILRLICSR